MNKRRELKWIEICNYKNESIEIEQRNIRLASICDS